MLSGINPDIFGICLCLGHCVDFHSSSYPFNTVLFNGDKGRGIFAGGVWEGILGVYEASPTEIHPKGILTTKYDRLYLR